ncbi:FAD-dependent oxidoreductase [Clostridium butyricum]|uniref:FAD-dependent oxidoreductase n=1 Tax=Clostridium butyricum TaxID=1492 RepID=A0AAP9RC30_CLOBU|nr:FAD-dependent oxidoreductase [Clostridium butyricum]MBZ5745727.1 FAD-dependent oxidoreductase [Clostridium butyricum]MDB2151764.1 FAD-dependent oxidoreductase [Clostridium butyricum]MDI9210746.1 FAD-dependent oxidoreductase [Clostridium butyricum]QMW89739.1 FAD-dependent oxidoreductase [Clostridium butyricum]BBK78198.1 hypothetical protein Cbu04g_32060 [Clostridium butyricum]
MSYDKIIIGAGLYGLYSALFCAKRGEKVLVLEYDNAPFKRATYINQARVHMGYHYPRSYSTAIKSAHYFERFMKDYSFCVLTEFDKIYATSANFSWTNAEQFMKFCKAANIRCDDVKPSIFFKEGMCDGAFLTTEYTYDANILKEYFLKELEKYPNVEIKYEVKISHINKNETNFEIILENEERYFTDFLLNATYASCNQILDKLGYEPFKIKYELCEIILCKVSDKLKNVGITVMDGPFFSIMPFGKTGYHSLTSVTFTPHMTSFESLPTFECQKRSNGFCSPQQLGNCNDCPAKPESAWAYMSNMARKYLKDEYEFEYAGSLFSMKPILKASEIDDSRPTVIKQYWRKPTFVSVLSGKINTVYDLDEVLLNGNK